MDIKRKIWEVLAVYNDYTNNTEYEGMKVITFTYNDEDFDIYKKDLEIVKEIINDLEVLEILKPFLKRSLHIEKIDLTKEENKIYKGYLPKDYNKTYIYKWDYNHSIWDMFRNEENAIKLKEWLEK